MASTFTVGEWTVERDLNRITRGDTIVPIEPRIVEVLAYLARYPGQVRSKEEILRSVWADTFVSESVLTYSVSELRKAFSDDARNPRVIQTIPRRGYRLIARVTMPDAALKPSPSIAVLSLSDMSPERDQEHFCDGIAEEIINILARLKGLRVASRTSSFSFKGKAEDVRTIARKLGVDSVLDGSVRKAGTHLRITAQLISGEDGCHLLTERYDRELKDVFAIQDEIARRIAAALEVTLATRDGVALGQVPTKDLQAYEYYLRGRQYFYQYTGRGMEFALKMFSQAIELDPDYVRAHAGMADCCTFLYLYAGSQDVHLEQADHASRRAVELAPDSAEAHASRGQALALRGLAAEAEREFQTAIQLDPMLFEAHYFYARTAFAQGELEKAIELYEKASEVNTSDYQSPLLVAQIYDDLGHSAEAEASRRRGIRIAEERLKLNPDDARATYMGANGLVALGEYEKGLNWAQQAMSMDPDEPMLLYNVACIQSLAGRLDAALDSLERAVRNGLTQKGWLEHDSNLDPLRGSPRYLALIRLIDDAAAAAHPVAES
jgi:adenylate cyclase